MKEKDRLAADGEIERCVPTIVHSNEGTVCDGVRKISTGGSQSSVGAAASRSGVNHLENVLFDRR